MTERNDGGPAFPMSVAASVSGDVVASCDVSGGMGMSLRDYFAGRFLADMGTLDESKHEAIAKAAYSQADAMLAERAK